jgi:hypothetical protein
MFKDRQDIHMHTYKNVCVYFSIMHIQVLSQITDFHILKKKSRGKKIDNNSPFTSATSTFIVFGGNFFTFGMYLQYC